MLKTRIEVDLPGVEVLRSMGPIEWIRSLFGERIDLRSGQVQTTISAFSLLEGLHKAFSRVGVTDAVSFLVDKRVIYVDTQEVTHDLTLVWQAALERKVLDRAFHEMHLVLTRHQAGIHLLFDIRLTARVVQGDPHLTVDIAGRPEELRIRRGESAQEYALRIQHLTSNDGGAEAYRDALDAIGQDVATALRHEIPGAVAEVVPSKVQLVRPGNKQLSNFRHLQFGQDVTEPSYRPVPSKARHGAYADPFVYYWHDPYWDFTNFLLISSMLNHHHWHTPEVIVVDSGGQQLFDGAHVDPSTIEPVLDQVELGADGVQVDQSIPDAGWGGDDLAQSDAWGSSDVGSSDSWGSSDSGGSDGWGGSDVGSSDSSSGSSCGSSCGGSSCGGGCGGGGGD
jgi:hypothetical protein